MQFSEYTFSNGHFYFSIMRLPLSEQQQKQKNKTKKQTHKNQKAMKGEKMFKTILTGGVEKGEDRRSNNLPQDTLFRFSTKPGLHSHRSDFLLHLARASLQPLRFCSVPHFAPTVPLGRPVGRNKSSHIAPTLPFSRPVKHSK